MVVPKDDAKLPRPEAVLRIVLRDGSVVERDITQNEVAIGKGPQNDIILPDASVSGAHAVIRFEDGAYKISDLGSRNGTSVNDARLGAEPRAIQHGDLIKMGHCALTFRLKETGDTLSMPQRTLIMGVTGTPLPPPAPPAPKPAALTEDVMAAALVSSGLAPQGEVERLRGRDARGRRLYRALIEERLATEIELRDLMSRTFNVPPVELKTMDVDAPVAVELRPQFLLERLVCPVVMQPERLALVVADPTDLATIDEAERVTRKKASLRLATPSEIAAHLDRFFKPRLVGVMPSGEKIEATLDHLENEIGKAAHNRIVLSDPTVSGAHAIVLARDGGYNIADLGSSNGTFVNGRKLGNESHVLQHGDKIQLGQALLTFRNPAETVENKTARLSPEALEEIRLRAMTQSSPPGPRTEQNSWAAPLGAPVDGAGEEKKKKKKKKDERLKAAMVSGFSRIVAQAIGVLLTVGLTIYVLNREPNGSKHIKPDFGKLKNSSDAGDGPLTPSTDWKRLDNGLLGGRLESSGVAYSPGMNGVIIVSDNRGGEAQWMQLDENGHQVGDIKKIPLGVNLIDPEAITYGNSSFYVVASQSDSNAGAANSIVRFDINPETQTLRGKPEVISDLRSFLLKNVAEIASFGAPPGAQGGLNIEGLAWDPIKERLLLGLRSPQISEQAVIIPLKLREARGQFRAENLKVDEPILLQLDGQGVRDITYDSHLRNFLIISGAPETAENKEFGLWEWSGLPKAEPTKLMTLQEDRKPEGVASVTINGRSYAFVVGDAGSYLKLDYK
jgi:pSer/pThr/pTyr-binding forkhead associated (FHA) protein